MFNYFRNCFPVNGQLVCGYLTKATKLYQTSENFQGRINIICQRLSLQGLISLQEKYRGTFGYLGMPYYLDVVSVNTCLIKLKCKQRF